MGEVAEFGQQQFLHREFASRRRTREGDHDPAMHRAGQRPAEERGGTDFLIREHPEQFAEALQLLIEQGPDRLDRRVARRNTGPAVDYNRVVMGYMLDHERTDAFGIVGNYRIMGDDVADTLKQLADDPPALVVHRGPRVAGRDHDNLETLPGAGVLMMLMDGHGFHSSYNTSRTSGFASQPPARREPRGIESGANPA